MYSTLCRIAGLAFSFALIPTLEIWQERTSRFIYAMSGPLHSRVFKS